MIRVIERGTVFTPDDITFWAGKGEGRTLEDALAEADILVSTPHGGSAMTEEVGEFVVDDYTERLQLDYTDCTTAPICRAWAAIDPRVIYVENPHPRLIRDPNRAKLADVAATLREALRRVAEAGPGNRVDLTGVDAIRPVSFSFRPVLVVPESDAELTRLTKTFAAVAAAGLEVYERTRGHLQRPRRRGWRRWCAAGCCAGRVPPRIPAGRGRYSRAPLPRHHVARPRRVSQRRHRRPLSVGLELLPRRPPPLTGHTPAAHVRQRTVLVGLRNHVAS